MERTRMIQTSSHPDGKTGEPEVQIKLAVLAYARCHMLTTRETEVLVHVCMGAKNDAIGTRLRICTATVRLHLGNIYRKTAVADKLELILSVWKHSLEQMPDCGADSIACT